MGMADILEQMSLVQRGEISQEECDTTLTTRHGMEELMEAFERFK